MSIVIHTADSRGLVDMDWLHSRHTFSFGQYYNPDRMGLGSLRVINDDVVAPSMGFDTHPHNNMEIVSIPLEGQLRHADSMGNTQIIRTGEVQLMSAGTGIHHSEYNDSDKQAVNFLQIWIEPATRNTNPRYAQRMFATNDRMNQLQLVISPDGRDDSLSINQQAYMSLLNWRTSTLQPEPFTYQPFLPDSQLYLLILEGQGSLSQPKNLRTYNLERRDGAALTPSHCTIQSHEFDALFIELAV